MMKNKNEVPIEVQDDAVFQKVSKSNSQEPWKVAIIDDEPMLRELLEEIISDLGYQTACFPNAILALAELTRQPAIETERGAGSETVTYEKNWFDIIVSDVKMPGMSGMEFYEQVDAMDANQAARIIFVTGDRHNTSVQDFFARTGNLWLEKPFRRADLKTVLDALRLRC